jgi:hypothetical protein
VTTLRATGYDVAVSSDGRDWRTIAQVLDRTTGTIDTLRFPPTRARYISVRIAASTDAQPPLLEELTAA